MPTYLTPENESAPSRGKAQGAVDFVLQTEPLIQKDQECDLICPRHNFFKRAL